MGGCGSTARICSYVVGWGGPLIWTVTPMAMGDFGSLGPVRDGMVQAG
jgi:hypothetical protein